MLVWICVEFAVICCCVTLFGCVVKKNKKTASSTPGGWSRWNILMCFYIYHSEHYGLSFLDLTDATFFLQGLPFFVSTLCMCVMYLTLI